MLSITQNSREYVGWSDVKVICGYDTISVL